VVVVPRKNNLGSTSSVFSSNFNNLGVSQTSSCLSAWRK
jgi:hypothetical protein